MGDYSVYQLLWLFFIYSFLGWVYEVCAGATKHKRFVNRGLVNGPFCVIYGIGAILMSIGLKGMNGIVLFVFAVIYAAVIEWAAGHLIERYFHERWWDYSGIKWNFDGYICAAVSLAKGALGFLAVRYGNDIFLGVYSNMPMLVIHIILIALIALLSVDIVASFVLVKGKDKKNLRNANQQKNAEWLENANDNIDKFSKRLGNWIYNKVTGRIDKAYPDASTVKVQERDKNVFASGCDIYKIIMLFFIGAFLGDITETIFCRITAGVWMSRSSVVWGPFSIVWGLAIALVTALLYRYKDKSDWFLFWVGTFLGGAYEYLCSVFTEIVFGKVFWDYSGFKYNLGGRINLLYCFFWGIAAVVWFKLLYPTVSSWIEKIPLKFGKVLTWVLVAFMCCNIVVSCMALIRYDERGNGVPAEEIWQEWMDVHYDDARMKRIYPNATTID